MATPPALDATRAAAYVDAAWDRNVMPALLSFIRIPNKSPHFDPHWEAHGHMERATQLVADWCEAHKPEGAAVEIVRLEGRTPLVFVDVPATGGLQDDTVLLYGHLDKQPEMTGWSEGLDPWTPVLRDDRLYGRGGADDGYAAFAAIEGLRAMDEQGVPRHRAVILIEACEESGSPDLPHYVEHLAERIGTPSLVICLDSGCGDYERLWLTTSLRGIVVGRLQVQVLTEGVHSGDAGGVVPSSFRIARRVLSRLEDEVTGQIRLNDLHTPVPPERMQQAREAAAVLGAGVHARFPFVERGGPVSDAPLDCVLNRTWRPTLEITGADGIPSVADAGNVLRPGTTLKISLRLPPTCDADRAVRIVRRVLEQEPPHGARVRLLDAGGATGWNAPELEPWLAASLDVASQAQFGAPAAYMGEGGTIPFMGMLGEQFPEAQFVVTGVLGPGANAHGPNEYLHLPTARRITAVIAHVLRDHGAR